MDYFLARKLHRIIARAGVSCFTSLKKALPMDTGVYVALSKEIGIMRDFDVTSNNIANMTTTGYQGEELLFSDYLVPTTPQENNVAFANDISTYRSLEQGTLQQTGGMLDVAIQGAGYFVINTPLGQRYTRNGNFKIAGDGTMVTSDGYTVLDDTGQPISFDPGDRKIDVREDGTVSVDQTDRAKIRVVQFDNPQLMRHVGKNLLASDVPPRPASNFTVANGMLERSNVVPFKELTHMMYLSRVIASTINFISTTYTLERKASDTLAKIYT